MSGSATSTTKSETGTVRTYASLRFMGDRLEPGRISAILGTVPTLAYRKGEVFKRSRGHELRGRTGLWLFSTRHGFDHDVLADHLRQLLQFLRSDCGQGRVNALRELMAEDGLEADVSCFWYGEHGATPPAIPEEIRAAFAQIGATIETDFDTD